MTATDHALATVARLTGEGQWSRAIEVLTAANRTQRDALLEEALVDVRHRGWPHLTGRKALHVADPDAHSPPVGPLGLPAVPIEDLTASAVRAALLTHGSLLIPGALTFDQVAQMKAAIDTSVEQRDAGDLEGADGWWRPLQLDAVESAAVGHQINPLHRNFIHDSGGVLLVDSPRSVFDLLTLYDSLGLYDVITEYLGDRPTLSAQKCTLRRVGVDQQGGWHQDGAFLGERIRAINVWVTLTDCGEEAPGLDLVPRRLDEIVETGTAGAYFEWQVGERLINDVAGATGTIRPRLSAGDMLIFDEMMLHRTATDPAMTLPRYAIEFWCFAASNYPDGHIPLVW